MKLRIQLLILTGLFLTAPLVHSAGFDHVHSAFARVLDRFVSTNGVDYAGLKAQPADLDAYLDEVARVSGPDFEEWSRPQRLALLINLYNAATLKLVVDHHPVTGIRKIGGWLTSPWELPVVRLWGRTNSLDWLEHGIIRPRYAEPRIHFAVVCAAKGCPPLRTEPFIAERLDAQLDDQTRRFLAQRDKNRLDVATRTLHLSPIFKWYRGDFEIDGDGLQQFLRPYFSEAEVPVLDDPKLRIRFTDYDWSLNEAPPAQQVPGSSQ